MLFFNLHWNKDRRSTIFNIAQNNIIDKFSYRERIFTWSLMLHSSLSSSAMKSEVRSTLLFLLPASSYSVVFYGLNPRNRRAKTTVYSQKHFTSTTLFAFRPLCILMYYPPKLFSYTFWPLKFYDDNINNIFDVILWMGSEKGKTYIY